MSNAKMPNRTATERSLSTVRLHECLTPQAVAIFLANLTASHNFINRRFLSKYFAVKHTILIVSEPWSNLELTLN
jgi:hypothetical protein